MKENSKIEKLEELVASTKFPTTPDQSFRRFTGILHDVVEKNFGYEIARDLSWDDSAQEFYFETKEQTRIAGKWGEHHAMFTIAPSAGVRAELERVVKEMGAWKAALAEMASPKNK